jgi:hypothetical protein
MSQRKIKMRRLSKLIKTKYAYCGNCKEYFIDDLPNLSCSKDNFYCPNGCGLPLHRNAEYLNIKRKINKSIKVGR